MSNKRMIAIVGSTGNQGGSVATTFSNLPGWNVRGVTRDPSKPSALALKEKGVELISADLNSIESLTKAFSNADVVFGSTDSWGHMRDPDVHAEANARGTTPNEVSYERESQQAKNIVDAAAANIDTLDRLMLSTLNDSKYWKYLKEKYPALWEKTSLLQMGFYAMNWKTTGMTLPTKTDKEGEYVLRMPISGDSKVPLVDTVADTGNFVKALLELPPKINMMGAGSNITWKEYGAIWGRVNNKSVSFESYPVSVLEDQKGSLGRELGAMFTYMDDPVYDGGDPNVIYPWDVKSKYGVEVQYTTIEEYVTKQDYRIGGSGSLDILSV